jgi:ABC-type spermidine/putrescine transport system permease subunit II
LAGLLGKVLEEYQTTHPATTPTEVKAALRLVSATSGSNQVAAMGVLAGVLSLLVGALVLGLFLFRGGTAREGVVFLPMIIMGIVVLLGIAVLVMKARS